MNTKIIRHDQEDRVTMSKISILALKVPILRTFLKNVKLPNFWLKYEKRLKTNIYGSFFGRGGRWKTPTPTGVGLRGTNFYAKIKLNAPIF